ncbi:MAG: uracil-DNA glycosylase [Neisseriaceae bacterium]|nr:uracil-DNA glycosylase [Neisseriaceae bacterium]
MQWTQAIGCEKTKPYFRQILQRINEERNLGHEIYPKNEDIFNAFRYTEFDAVKVVILGQDPYHDVGQAHGLAFSVKHGVSIPPSLRNIYKELSQDLPNFVIPNHGCLTHWADEGVLLLNNVLSVRAHSPNSHRDIGWEIFTDYVVHVLNSQRENLVFLLWGASAQKKGAHIDEKRHLILKAPHPSPLSANRGFFGCRHFSKANQYLIEHGIKPVDWNIQSL